MPRYDCACAHAPQSPSLTLHRVDADQHVHVCTEVLSTAARLKADLHDPSGQATLTDHAYENGWGLWRSEHSLYLIPSIAPFCDPVGDHAMVPAHVAGVGDGT